LKERTKTEVKECKVKAKMMKDGESWQKVNGPRGALGLVVGDFFVVSKKTRER
jgi:hypothetical protein